MVALNYQTGWIMGATIRVVEPPECESEFRSLREWLAQEDELRGIPIKQQFPVMAPEQMGCLADTLVIAFGAGGFGTVLAQSVVSWLQACRTDLRLTVTGPRGMVELQTRSPKDIQQLIREIRAVLDEE